MHRFIEVLSYECIHEVRSSIRISLESIFKLTSRSPPITFILTSRIHHDQICFASRSRILTLQVHVHSLSPYTSDGILKFPSQVIYLLDNLHCMVSEEIIVIQT